MIVSLISLILLSIRADYYYDSSYSYGLFPNSIFYYSYNDYKYYTYDYYRRSNHQYFFLILLSVFSYAKKKQSTLTQHRHNIRSTAQIPMDDKPTPRHQHTHHSKPKYYLRGLRVDSKRWVPKHGEYNVMVSAGQLIPESMPIADHVLLCMPWAALSTVPADYTCSPLLC